MGSRTMTGKDSRRGVRNTVTVLVLIALAVYAGFILRGVLNA
jgi:hypothetical protein